jgi:hypothetical protein
LWPKAFPHQSPFVRLADCDNKTMPVTNATKSREYSSICLPSAAVGKEVRATARILYRAEDLSAGDV